MGTGALPVFALVLYKEGKAVFFTPSNLTAVSSYLCVNKARQAENACNLANEGRVTFIAQDKMLTEHLQAIVRGTVKAFWQHPTDGLACVFSSMTTNLIECTHSCQSCWMPPLHTEP